MFFILTFAHAPRKQHLIPVHLRPLPTPQLPFDFPLNASTHCMTRPSAGIVAELGDHTLGGD
jgi:hypothetical protein